MLDQLKVTLVDLEHFLNPRTKGFDVNRVYPLLIFKVLILAAVN
jgi:hypothetical protein